MALQYIVTSYRIIQRYGRDDVWNEIQLFDKANNHVGSLYFVGGHGEIPAATNVPFVKVWYPIARYADTNRLLRDHTPLSLIYKDPGHAFLASLHQTDMHNEAVNDDVIDMLDDVLGTG